MNNTVVDSRKGNRNLDHIPGEYGLPFFGKSFDFLKDPKDLFERMHKKYGLVHKSGMYFERYIALLGPDNVGQILADKEKNFSSCNGWHKFIGRFFDRGLMLLDFDEHRLHRRAMQEAFKANALRGYCQLIDDVVGRHTLIFNDQLTAGDKLKIYPFIKELTLDIANSAFIGESPGKESTKIKNAFVDCVEASLVILKLNLPFTKYRKGIEGRQYLEKYFRRQIPSRINTNKNDLFSILCNLDEVSKSQMSKDDIVSHMIFLMMAAHDTTASALTNIIFELSRNPQWQNRLREEVAPLKNKTPTYEELSELPEISKVLKEILRLYAPVRAIPRRSIRECTVNGVLIPENTYVWVCPEFTHRMPEYWTNPDQFDPDRFAPHRNEHKSHPYAFFPYGSGAHKCIGMHFSELVVKITLVKLLNAFEFTADGEYDPDYQIVPFPKPKDDLVLKVTKSHREMLHTKKKNEDSKKPELEHI